MTYNRLAYTYLLSPRNILNCHCDNKTARGNDFVKKKNKIKYIHQYKRRMALLRVVRGYSVYNSVLWYRRKIKIPLRAADYRPITPVVGVDVGIINRIYIRSKYVYSDDIILFYFNNRKNLVYYNTTYQ